MIKYIANQQVAYSVLIRAFLAGHRLNSKGKKKLSKAAQLVDEFIQPETPFTLHTVI